jgi:hypothetical protein
MFRIQQTLSRKRYADGNAAEWQGKIVLVNGVPVADVTLLVNSASGNLRRLWRRAVDRLTRDEVGSMLSVVEVESAAIGASECDDNALSARLADEQRAESVDGIPAKLPAMKFRAKHGIALTTVYRVKGPVNLLCQLIDLDYCLDFEFGHRSIAQRGMGGGDKPKPLFRRGNGGINLENALGEIPAHEIPAVAESHSPAKSGFHPPKPAKQGKEFGHMDNRKLPDTTRELTEGTAPRYAAEPKPAKRVEWTAAEAHTAKPLPVFKAE